MKNSKKTGIAVAFFIMFAITVHFITSVCLDRLESSCENAKCYLD